MYPDLSSHMLASFRDKMPRVGLVGLAVASVLLLSSMPVSAAGESGSGKPGKAVTFEAIPGSSAKRVILTEKAAQRLGLEVGKVSEEQIVRKQVLGGIFVAPSVVPPALTASATVTPAAAGTSFAVPPMLRSALTPPAMGDGLVRVMFSPHEWERVAKDQPARILKLAPRGGRSDGVIAKPSGQAPAEDLKRSMLTYFYVIEGPDHGFMANERVRVELMLENTGEKRKVIPYSAVYYDAKGMAWVYLNPKPLTYERQQIRVEQIFGDKAALLDGPDLDTTVVTVGAALLYGAEVYRK
jgi:hypothetical protein